MHPDDAGMAKDGDMFVNRKKPNAIIKTLLPLFTRFRKSERFTPDILLGDGTGLSEYGFEAKVLSLPGHSKGSIGILTDRGDLFENMKGPKLNALMDDPVSAKASLERLKGMKIGTVYPGHGQPFTMEALI